jgi:retinol dehydrogenase-12
MREYSLLNTLIVSDIIFCSGVMASPYNQLTKDGYDMQFGVNVLAHFHFTTLLLDRLLASPEPRVVNVSSIGHTLAFGKGVYLSTLKGSRKNSWITWIPGVELQRRYQAYGQSKLVSEFLKAPMQTIDSDERLKGNVLFSNELVRRYGDKGLISIALHPGFIDTDLTRHHGKSFQSLTVRHSSEIPSICLWYLTVLYVSQARIYSPPLMGAVTQLFAANAPEAKSFSGKVSHSAMAEFNMILR